MNLFSVTLFGIGAVLIYAGVTNRDPRTVVKEALSGKVAPKQAPVSTAPAGTAPMPAPGNGTAPASNGPYVSV